MPALGFRKRFVPHIVAKTKRHSIRGWSRVRFPIKSPLFMFTGLRTKYCARVGTAVTEEVRRVVIEPAGAIYFPDAMEQFDDDDWLNAFAQSDGFQDWSDLQRFWDTEHRGVAQFDGRMIIWGDSFRPVAIA